MQPHAVAGGKCKGGRIHVTYRMCSFPFFLFHYKLDNLHELHTFVVFYILTIVIHASDVNTNK